MFIIKLWSIYSKERINKEKYPDRRFLNLWNTAIATFSIGSIFAGVLAIYGTTNSLIVVYPVAGAVLVLLSLLSNL